MGLIHPKYFFPKNFRHNPGAGYMQMRVVHPCLWQDCEDSVKVFSTIENYGW